MRVPLILRWHVCLCEVFLHAYLFLSFIFSPGSLTVLLAQGFLLLVVQQ